MLSTSKGKMFLHAERGHTETDWFRSFDLHVRKNELIELFLNASKTCFYVGKFIGRNEMLYTLKNTGKHVFVYVVEGAYEVEYRLLEAGDALALWDTGKIEMK